MNSKSLSKKIIIALGVGFLILNVLVTSGIGYVTKEVFEKLEGEKADLIVKNYAPLMAIHLYLNNHERFDALADQMLKNKSVIKVWLTGDKGLFFEKGMREDFGLTIDVAEPLYKPNSNLEIGKLHIAYSTKEFDALLRHYAVIITIAALFILISFLMLNAYIQKLLSPLKHLAGLLEGNLSHMQTEIPYMDQKNEIGLIANALNHSRLETLQYAQNLHALNETLEEKVKEKTQELQDQLFTEAITKLPNRMALLDTLSMGAEEGILAILSLDNYKEIHDFYGHDIGDALLVAIKHKMLKIFHQSDYMLFKLPSNEFAVYAPKHESKIIFTVILKELANILNHNPFLIQEYEINVTFTIGASINAQPLLEKADIALQKAQNTKQPLVIYNGEFEIEKTIDANMQMVKKIKSAIKEDRIVPYFQPIFDNKTGNITSYECLVRLIEEDGRALSPYFFLEIAKKAKLYKQIMRIMVEKSCRAFQNVPYDFSINFEIDDILDEELVDFTILRMEKYGVAKQLTFEILESQGIEDIDAVRKFTQLVSSLGCKVAIDDFGSGYSNFTHLLRLNVDYLKIDGSLIKNIHTDHEAKIIVKSIVTFAKELGFKTVAEFVHCEAVQKEVLRLGINYSQGYLLGEPKPALVEVEEEVLELA